MKSDHNHRYITMKLSIVTDEMVKAALNQHQMIVDVIVGGQISDMKQVIQMHLVDSKDRLLKVIRQNGGSI